MRRGFLKSPGALSIAPREPGPSAALPKAKAPSVQSRPQAAPGDGLTRVVELHPRIVCSDIRLPPERAPHFMYLPPGRADMVFVDYLENLQAMARWPVWSQCSPDVPTGSSPLYEIRGIPGKGLGMVAQRHLKAGELIVSERPVYAQRADLPRSSDFNYFNGLPYIAPVSGLSPSAQASIYSLTTAFGTKRHRLAGIFHTNNLELDITHEPDPQNRFVGCFPTIARANHDCSPNSNYYFVFGSFSGQLRAMRDIEEGEEITISYCDALAPRVERQAALERLFCFTCGCPSCSLPEREGRLSDERRARLDTLVASIEQPSATVTLEQLRDGLQYSRQESLYAKYAQVLFYGSGTLLCRMDLQNGLEWARMAKVEYLTLEGEDSATLKALSSLLPHL
ncbi:SET domain-containing protein [Exidia glandulosa HHB12029]|uniref:SET domain-containing protein n=1 Tax=Exidia glandulosa HHB12029 TaxID=1314781 RepID=A0A166AWV2_EXIGL|nr:SET domain-containing protein [Exidia glandulosa HHB12029]